MALDIYGRTPLNPKIPYTADKALIDWGGPVSSAINVTINYSQAVQRRRTVGNKNAVIYAMQPIGRISIARLLIGEEAGSLFTQPGWNACDQGTIKVTFKGGCGDSQSTTQKDLTLTAIGCIVSDFTISAEAEGLTVLDNVSIEFLQLQQSS